MRACRGPRALRWAVRRRRIAPPSMGQGVCGFWRGERCEPAVYRLPPQHIHLPGIWPGLRVLEQACSNRIHPNVIPFRVVVFPAPKLRVPVLALPDRFLTGVGPAPRHEITPVQNPISQAVIRTCRSAEQMDVIRHHHVASDEPVIGRFPRRDQQGVRIRVRQQRTPPLHAKGEEDDRRAVDANQGRRMRGRFPFRQGDHAPETYHILFRRWSAERRHSLRRAWRGERCEPAVYRGHCAELFDGVA